MSGRQDYRTSRRDMTLETAALILVGATIFPVLLAALMTSLIIKRSKHAPIYILLSGGLGLLGSLYLFIQLHPIALFQLVLVQLVELIIHHDTVHVARFLAVALPFWLRGLLAFPLFVPVFSLFMPQSLEQQLLWQERRRRELQTRQSARARRKALHAPKQINGKPILGVLVEHPKQ